MAKMWPMEFPEEYKSDPSRRAERVVFESLRDNLPETFDVYWSRTWVNRGKNDNLRDGECDFVLLHPDLGFCVLEVKGGTVKNDPVTNKWTSTGAMGAVHTIHDPFNQSSTSKHILLDEFLEILKKKESKLPWIPCAHGVILPDVSMENFEAEAFKHDPKLIGFREDIGPTLLGWITSLMKNERGTKDYREKAYPLLKRYLEEHFFFPMSVDARLEEEESIMETLTEQQATLFEFFKLQPRIRVLGGAGTGKTVLAIREARRLADEGYRTALVCYNRGLAGYLQRQCTALLPNDTLHISTLHSLLWRGSRVDNPNEYKLPTRDQLQSSLSKGALSPFDAIIVDEGQDFVHDAWWSHLELLMQGPKILRVFWDSNQKVYEGKANLPQDLETHPIILTRILRNTKHIWKTAEPFYLGEPVTVITPEGLPVFEKVATSIESSIASIRNLLLQWVAEGMKPQEIAILVRDDLIVEKLRKILINSPIPINSCEELNRGNGVVLDTIRRYKGLEAIGVLLLADQGVIKEPELMYVGITRAKARLGILRI